MKIQGNFLKKLSFAFVLKRIPTSKPPFYNVSIRIGYILL